MSAPGKVFTRGGIRGENALRRPRSRSNPRTLLFEIGVFLLLAAYYEMGNLLWEVDDDPTPAYRNALSLWSLEKRVGIAWEQPAQRFFEPHAWAMWSFVFFYGFVHFGLTYGFAVWAYRYRFEAFAYIRNAAVLVTTTAFTFEWAFPVSPPRLMPEFAMHDTIKELLPVNNSTPWITSLVNDYAGFPSIHTSWSLLIAILAIKLTRSPWRWLWLGYPAMIAVSITATANHVTWDIVGAVAWVGGCVIVQDALVAAGKLPAASGLALRRTPPAPAMEEAGA